MREQFYNKCSTHFFTNSNLQGGWMEARLKLNEEQSKPNRNVAALPFLLWAF